MAQLCRFHFGHPWRHTMYPGGIRLLSTCLMMLCVTVHITSLTWPLSWWRLLLSKC